MNVVAATDVLTESTKTSSARVCADTAFLMSLCYFDGAYSLAFVRSGPTLVVCKCLGARNELSWSGVRPYCRSYANVCRFSALNWLNIADFASGLSRPRKEKWPDAPKSPAFGRAGGQELVAAIDDDVEKLTGRNATRDNPAVQTKRPDYGPY